MKKLELSVNYKEIKNEEKNGIEIYLESFPSVQDRTLLKDNCFKWNPAKKCWYKKINEIEKTTKKEIQKEILNLKTLKEITDFDEFMQIWNINHKNHYYGTKKVTPEEEKEIIKKHDLEDFKRYKLFATSDGYILKFDAKPSISKTLYYDDEYEDPGKSLKVFKNYNKSNFEYDLEEWEKETESLKNNGICSGAIETKPFININFENTKEVYPVFYQYFGKSRRDKNTVRELTEEEINDYLLITKQLKKEYDQRLENYFFKYNKNIHTCGYWANR